MTLEEYKRYLRNKVRAYVRQFEDQAIGELYLDDLSAAYEQVHSMDTFRLDMEHIHELGEDAADELESAAYNMKEAIEAAQDEIDEMVGLGYADPGYESRVMVTMENEVLPLLETALSDFKADALSALANNNPRHHRNPLTDDQHREGYRRADALEDAYGAIGARQHGRGDRPNSLANRLRRARVGGAKQAHRAARQGEIWPPKHEGQSAQWLHISEFGAGDYDLSQAFGMDPMIEENPKLKKDGKWHRYGDNRRYYMKPKGPDDSVWRIFPYSPRSKNEAISNSSRRIAADYVRYKGQEIPSGTKYILSRWPTSQSCTYEAYRATRPATNPALDRPMNLTAHRTLAAAKKAATSRRSNPWPTVPSGPLASSYSPPIDPTRAIHAGAGPLASSYSPPVSPFGAPAYESGTLQGPEATRTVPGYPLYPGPPYGNG